MRPALALAILALAFPSCIDLAGTLQIAASGQASLSLDYAVPLELVPALSGDAATRAGAPPLDKAFFDATCAAAGATESYFSSREDSGSLKVSLNLRCPGPGALASLLSSWGLDAAYSPGSPGTLRLRIRPVALPTATDPVFAEAVKWMYRGYKLKLQASGEMSIAAVEGGSRAADGSATFEGDTVGILFGAAPVTWSLSYAPKTK